MQNVAGSYRPITLLSIPGKVFAHVLLARLNPLLTKHRRPEQSGFTAGRSTVDAILALRLLCELHREFNQPLSVAYVDLKAAFDSVDRKALWNALQGVGVPEHLLNLIKDLHTDTTAKVRQGNGTSPSFLTRSGVRQGCILAPSLFCCAMDWILDRVTANAGISIGQFHFSDLTFADDVALVSHSSNTVRNTLDLFQQEASHLGLKISWQKTKIQNMPRNNQPANIVLHGQTVEAVDDFIYLGSKISNTGCSEPDTLRRLGLASSAMNSLHKVWKLKKLKLTTKLAIYRTCIIPVLLYGSDTWTLLKSDLRRLEAFHQRCQRTILGIRWYDYVTNVEVTQRTALPTIGHLVGHRRGALFSHAARLADNTPAKKALNIAINCRGRIPPSPGWSRPRGRPKSSWLKQLGQPSEIDRLWSQATNRGHRRSARRTPAVYAVE